MAEERKGHAIEKWDDVKGRQTEETVPEPVSTADDNQAVRKVENLMHNLEEMLEQNDNSIDGVINNLPKPEEVERDKESVIKKLKDRAKTLDEETERLPKMHCPVLERE